MILIEVKALSNGAHRNQITNKPLTIIPDGWAVVPDGMELENFPFGTVTARKVNGIKTVTDWTPGVIPEPEPVVIEPTTDDIINTLLGVSE